MLEQSLLLKLVPSEVADDSTSHIRQEYQANKYLFQAQPIGVQQFLRTQAAALAEAVAQSQTRARFSLPDRVVCPALSDGPMKTQTVPVERRMQAIGGLWSRISRLSLLITLCRRLSELEGSVDQAVAVGAGLLRYAIATHMVSNMLPAGRSVVYVTPEGDDIPNQPVINATGQVLAAVAPASPGREPQAEMEPVTLLSPYVEAARHFYFPQWVAFDHQGHLLSASVSEAEAHVASMQRYLEILNLAIVIAPYMLVDDIWHQKRYGILGQLVNQGRALAHYQSQEMIQTIRRRIAEHRLDRGLRLSLPYFDDQTLRIETLDFTVIPAGWVMFTPAFAVLAAREQQAKVAENTRLSFATRKHLLSELQDLELAFISR